MYCSKDQQLYGAYYFAHSIMDNEIRKRLLEELSVEDNRTNKDHTFASLKNVLIQSFNLINSLYGPQYWNKIIKSEISVQESYGSIHFIERQINYISEYPPVNTIFWYVKSNDFFIKNKKNIIELLKKAKKPLNSYTKIYTSNLKLPEILSLLELNFGIDIKLINEEKTSTNSNKLTLQEVIDNKGVIQVNTAEECKIVFENVYINKLNIFTNEVCEKLIKNNKNLCINPKRGTYCNKKFYTDDDIKIYQFKDVQLTNNSNTIQDNNQLINQNQEKNGNKILPRTFVNFTRSERIIGNINSCRTKKSTITVGYISNSTIFG